MSSRANSLRKRAAPGHTGFSGTETDALAQQLAKLILGNPGAVELIATALASHLQANQEHSPGARRTEVPAITRDAAIDLDIDPLIPLELVKRITGLGKTQIYALIREGKFPAPYKPGGTASRWSLAEVQAWRRQLKPVR